MEEKRGKRIVDFLGKVVEYFKMEIPPLTHSFLVADFINFGSDQDEKKGIT